MSANRQTDLPSRLEAWFRTRAGAEERLTFPVHANLGAVVKFERLAPVVADYLRRPTLNALPAPSLLRRMARSTSSLGGDWVIVCPVQSSYTAKWRRVATGMARGCRT